VGVRSGPCEGERTRIEVPLLVTGAPGEVLRDATVLVEGETLRWVGPTRSAPPSDASERVLRLTGAVVPGLIDAHVHLAFDGGDDPYQRLRDADDDERLAIMEASASDLLAAGVTTVRDLGAPDLLDMRLRSEVGRRGPRLVLAGRPITTVGGHCWFLGGEAASAAEAQRLIDENIAAGADLVKVMVTGGFMTSGSSPWTNQFDTGSLQQIVDHAHDRGVRVAAHAHGTPGIAAAAAVGVDTIEHCMWVAEDGLSFSEEVADVIAARGIAVCATVNLNARGPGKVAWAPRASHLGELRRRGVSIVAGTDAGIARTPHGAFAASLPILCDIGFTPLEAIGAATSGAAAALGLGDTVGLLRPGFAADLVVAAADPTTDASVLQEPTGIMLGGRWIVTPTGKAVM